MDHVDDERLQHLFAKYSSHYLPNVNQIRQLDYPNLPLPHTIRNNTQCMVNGSTTNSTVYLDHAGATLYPQRILDSWIDELRRPGGQAGPAGVFGNPHSASSPSAQLTSLRVSNIRQRILRYLNAPPGEYSVIFTANATAGLKLFAESVAWGDSTREGQNVDGAISSEGGTPQQKGHQQQNQRTPGEFWYLRDSSHTSVVGMREMVRAFGGKVRCVSAAEADEYLGESQDGQKIHNTMTGGIKVFAYPAQCNFSGVRYPLEWVNEFHRIPPQSKNEGAEEGGGEKGWYVLLDVSSYATTTPLDLGRYRADFVVLSFYKMFGFPTGLGALIVRNKSADVCMTKRLFFGGGTVSAVTVGPGSSGGGRDGEGGGWHLLREDLSARFEDGTLPFLEILALDHGFDYVEKQLGGWESVSRHARCLADFVREVMDSMRHDVEGPDQDAKRRVCCLYPSMESVDFATEEGSSGKSAQTHRSRPQRKLELGPIINFNLLRADGSVVGYSEVMRLAAIHDIHIRTGCFCNPGACQKYLGLDAEEVRQNAEVHGHVCWDDQDIINGKPTGSVRISFGFMTTLDDVLTWLRFLRTYFISFSTSPPLLSPTPLPTTSTPSRHRPLARISHIRLYPIKSCGALVVSEWPIGPHGLLYDRHWMLVDDKGVAFNQKKIPKMCLIRPKKLEFGSVGRELVLEAEGMERDLRISLEEVKPEAEGASGMKIRVCGDRVNAFAYTRPDVSRWFSQFLGTPCHLVQCGFHPTDSRKTKFDKKSSLLTPHQRENGYSTTTPAAASIAFANESQFLLTSQPSLEYIKGLIPDEEERRKVSMDSFRPNIVVESFSEGTGEGDSVGPFAEDAWQGRELEIHGQIFKVKGPCVRCQMINIDQQNADKTPEPYATLAKHRRQNGKILFGQHLEHDTVRSAAPFVIKSGSLVYLRS
ncbi:hypothetical protein HK102_001417 [Quaeritorhiza haematococci]|nr:hypothetical protein HK102_001417 [Quaeritorhiza haematococci]